MIVYPSQHKINTRIRNIFCASLFFTTALAHSQPAAPTNEKLSSAFSGREGTFILLNSSAETVWDSNPEESHKKLPPCSTFKIWNTLIGLETGIISSANEPFYQWDGKVRAIPQWNRSLTLKEAFQVSCVPAFQRLAREIGSEKMQLWIDKIGYGDRNLTAGIDVFWLPAAKRETILISPAEQAELIAKLVSGRLPFSEKSTSTLKEMMFVQKSEQGTLYGKTGTSVDAKGNYNMGWFVGYVESKGKTYTFACTLKGKKVMGSDARAVVETFLNQFIHLLW